MGFMAFTNLFNWEVRMNENHNNHSERKKIDNILNDSFRRSLRPEDDF
jgi:hypothetical protein